MGSCVHYEPITSWATFAPVKQLTPQVLEQATSLINELRSGLLDDERLSETVTKLDALLLDPRWFTYTIDHVPELSADFIVRKAFEYKPFQMPPPSDREKI